MLCEDDSKLMGSKSPFKSILLVCQGQCSASQASLGLLLKITFPSTLSLPGKFLSEMDSVSGGTEGLNEQTVNGSGRISLKSWFQHCFHQNDGFGHKPLIGLYNSVIPTTDEFLSNETACGPYEHASSHHWAFTPWQVLQVLYTCFLSSRHKAPCSRPLCMGNLGQFREVKYAAQVTQISRGRAGI